MRTIKLLTSIFIIFVFCLVLIRTFFYAPNDEIPLDPQAIENIQDSVINTDSTKTSTTPEYPAYISIPKLEIDTEIQKVGISKKGNMAAPNNFTDVGWYKYGVIPGNSGSAIIAGHVNNGIALPAVFSRLEELQEGDDIYIKREDGQLLHFSVTKTDVFNFDSRLSEVFTGNDQKLIKLITCTGTWIQDYKTHDKRLVVTAVLVEK